MIPGAVVIGIFGRVFQEVVPAIVILTTVPDSRTGRRIAKLLVRKKLAACVSVRGGWTSFYRWKGKLECAAETLLLIKTRKNRFEKVQAVLKSVHPYQLPEILALTVQRGSKGYLSWLDSSLK